MQHSPIDTLLLTFSFAKELSIHHSSAMSIYIPDENGELSALDATVHIAQTSAPIQTGDLGAAFAKMLISLVVLVALLFASYWFIRRLIQNRLQKGGSNGSIHVLEKRMISPKTMLYLIEVDQKKILIAESHLEVKRLTALHSEEYAEH